MRHVQIVVSSRGDPPLPTPRLQTRGHRCEVRIADLSFAVEEAGELVRVNNDIRFGSKSAQAKDQMVEKLTDRELVVLRKLTGTGTRKDIAAELHISLSTVKTHIYGITHKFGTRRRKDIVTKARKTGIIR